MTMEVQDGSLNSAPVPAVRKSSWRERRWERRRRRRLYEEAAGWLLVPAILFGCYWAIDAALGALGTSPAALVQGIQTIITHH